jgi:predicted metal-binding membrane protein
MILMIGFGVMNILAMVGLALIIAIEKHWKYGEIFAKGVGVASIIWALVIVVEPGAAPGLDPSSLKRMGQIGSF